MKTSIQTTTSIACKYFSYTPIESQVFCVVVFTQKEEIELIMIVSDSKEAAIEACKPYGEVQLAYSLADALLKTVLLLEFGVMNEDPTTSRNTRPN